MADTLGALRLIERTAVSLCRALDDTAGALDRALGSGNAQQKAGSAAADAMLNQLRLWRAAWGPAESSLPLHRLMTLAAGLPNQVAVDVSALPGEAVFPPPLGRMVLNILLLAADSLPGGGQIVLAGAIDDLFIQIDGPTAAWPVGMALCLSQEAEARSALTSEGNLQMAVTASLAHATNIRLSALVPPSRQFGPAILRLGR